MRQRFNDTSLEVLCDNGICHYDTDGIEDVVLEDSDSKENMEEKTYSPVKYENDDFFVRTLTKKIDSKSVSGKRK